MGLTIFLHPLCFDRTCPILWTVCLKSVGGGKGLTFTLDEVFSWESETFFLCVGFIQLCFHVRCLFLPQRCDEFIAAPVTWTFRNGVFHPEFTLGAKFKPPVLGFSKGLKVKVDNNSWGWRVSTFLKERAVCSMSQIGDSVSPSQCTHYTHPQIDALMIGPTC